MLLKRNSCSWDTVYELKCKLYLFQIYGHTISDIPVGASVMASRGKNNMGETHPINIGGIVIQTKDVLLSFIS